MSLGTAAVRKSPLWTPAIMLGKYLAASCLGIFLGLVITFIEIEHGKGFTAIEAGPWTGWPRSEASEIDPYTRAILAYSGKISLSESEAMSFVAQGSSDGAAFDPDCDYTIKGEVPPARYWTLSLLSPAGALIGNMTDRRGFTSSEVLRASDGRFEITLSRHARPGNWLPLGSASKFILVLRLYDNELGATEGTLDAAHMPAIAKGRCR